MTDDTTEVRDGLPVRGSLDHDDPRPQIVGKGRLHEVRVSCYLPDGATTAELEEFLSCELGCGGCALDNPLNRLGLEVAEVVHVRDTGLDGYELWNAKGEDGKAGHRTGRTIFRRPDEALGVAYQLPAGENEGC